MPETLTQAAPPKIEAAAPPVPHALLSLCLPDDWTLDDATLEQLDELNPGWRIERGFSGELVINMGAGGHGPTIGFKLCMRLGLWVEEIGGGLGQDGTAGYNLLDDEGRNPEWEPDVSWISPEQLAAAGGSAPLARLLESLPDVRGRRSSRPISRWSRSRTRWSAGCTSASSSAG